MSENGVMLMKEWMESYRPVRQRTVRSETTKDKAGSLPPAVYSKPNQQRYTCVEFPSEPSTSGEPSRTTPITEHSLDFQELQAVGLTFVNDADVSDIQIQDKYETDSDGDSDGETELEVVSKTCRFIRSGRAVRAFVRCLDL